MSGWYKARLGSPDIDSAEIRQRLFSALGRGERSVRATYKRRCPACGRNAMVQDGALAAGMKLELYRPVLGEVLKNHYMECTDCGFEQGS